MTESRRSGRIPKGITFKRSKKNRRKTRSKGRMVKCKVTKMLRLRSRNV